MKPTNLNHDLYFLLYYIEQMRLAYCQLDKIKSQNELDDFLEIFDIDVLQLKYYGELIEKDLKQIFGSVINPAVVGRYSSKTRLKIDEPAAAHNN